MPDAGRAELTDRTRADFFCACSRPELPGQLLRRHREKVLQGSQRFRVRGAVVEHSEEARQLQATSSGLVQEALNLRPAVVRDDLRQVELGGHAVSEEVTDLR